LNAFVGISFTTLLLLFNEVHNFNALSLSEP
jgi:hypothetical protein